MLILLFRLSRERTYRRLMAAGSVLIVGSATTLTALSDGSLAPLAVLLVGLVALIALAVSLAGVSVAGGPDRAREKEARKGLAQRSRAAMAVSAEPLVVVLRQVEAGTVDPGELAEAQAAALRQEDTYRGEAADRAGGRKGIVGRPQTVQP